LSHRGYTESIETYRARRKLKDIFRTQNYRIEEFKEFPEVTDNMGSEIWPPYEADILLYKVFIIELDSRKLHGTHKKIIHDKWRDKNFKEQIDVPTVRLLSKDVNMQTPEDILQEINWQLQKQIQEQ
jgi:hypothetical protein